MISNLYSKKKFLTSWKDWNEVIWDIMFLQLSKAVQVQPIDSTHQFAFFDKRKINPKKSYTVFILKTKFTKLI